MKDLLSWVERYLRDTYAFRYNVVRDQIEWRRLDQEAKFVTQGDYEFNSLAMELDRALEAAGSPGFAPFRLQKLLHSDFVPRYHPVREYYQSLPARSGTAAIRALAGTVTVTNSERFIALLTKWLVAVVANALEDEGCQNHTCLILVGPQGVGKTTWLNNLIPPRLKSYLYSGPVVPDSKEAMTLLADSLLINLDDQMRTLSHRYTDSLKSLITQGKVEFRRAYAARNTRYPRLASFMGSANVGDFLNDSSGSRRFLTFVATNIALDEALCLDMDAVWAEVWALYQAGFAYWLTEKEIAELNAVNEDFREPSFEEELVRRHLQVSSKGYLGLDEIILKLTARADKQRLNQKAITAALRRIGATNEPRRGSNGRLVRGWNVAFTRATDSTTTHHTDFASTEV